MATHPVAKGAHVTYYVKRNGSWHKIGSNKTGHSGKAGKTFAETEGKKLTFRVKVAATSATSTGTSSAKSVTVG